jgi:hypothetical protein
MQYLIGLFFNTIRLLHGCCQANSNNSSIQLMRAKLRSLCQDDVTNLQNRGVSLSLIVDWVQLSNAPRLLLSLKCQASNFMFKRHSSKFSLLSLRLLLQVKYFQVIPLN